MCVASSETTDERPTSDPVPAVVGTATNHGMGNVIARTCGWSHAYSRMSPGCCAIRATALATSSAAPPPTPMTASARCALYAAAPAMTWLRTGLPKISENTATSRPGRSASSVPEQRQRGDAAVGDQQRPRNALRLQMVGDEPRAPAPKWIVVGKLKRSMVMVHSAGSRSCVPCRNILRLS